MFRKVLVANRGGIALRIIRACRELGIGTVATYSSADPDYLPAALADQAVHIGPPAPEPDQPHIIAAALRTDVDAIHPGYGLLAEDAEFALACANNGLSFIGPPPDVLTRLGDKASTRRLMGAAGLPLLPGSPGALGSVDEAVAVADEIGFPVVIRPSKGRPGTVVVHRRDGLPGAYRTALSDAVCRKSGVYLEKHLCSARRLEVRVLCDNYGTGVHLGVLDRTPEFPAPAVDAALRARLGAAAVRGALAAGYRGAGTVEFALDRFEGADRFWFHALNARVRLERSLAEPIGLIGLITEQLRIAAGSPLSFGQRDIPYRDAVIAGLIMLTPDRGGLLDRVRHALGGASVIELPASDRNTD